MPGHVLSLKMILCMGDLDSHLIMLPWAHPSPWPKRHLYRFSRFCNSSCQSIDGHVGAWFLGSTRLSIPKRHLDRFSRFCTAHGRQRLYFTMGALSPKIAYSNGVSGPHLIHGSLGPSESSAQTASWSVQPFLQGSLLWQTDRPTDDATRSVTIGRIYVRSITTRPNNASFKLPFWQMCSTVQQWCWSVSNVTGTFPVSSARWSGEHVLQTFLCTTMPKAIISVYLHHENENKG